MAKKFPASFLKCINSTEINHVRAGEDRTKFTGIWMVVVKGRIFARSYYFRARSWYNTFYEGASGDIRCTKETVAVKGIRPADLEKITPAVNAAYEAKYCIRPGNRKWVDGLCEARRVQKTMEFVRLD